MKSFDTKDTKDTKGNYFLENRLMFLAFSMCFFASLASLAIKLFSALLGDPGGLGGEAFAQ